MANLPTDIDATYPDRSAGDAAHQQHHDALHADVYNVIDNAPDDSLFVKEGGVLVPVGRDTYVAGTVVVKSADETVNNSATLQDDDELTFDAAANADYACTFQLFIFSDVDTTDFQFTITAPTGATVAFGPIGGNRGSDLLMEQDSYRNTAGTAISVQMGAGASYPLMVQLSVRNGSTAGAVTLQWAQNTASANDTTVRAGSTLSAHKV